MMVHRQGAPEEMILVSCMGKALEIPMIRWVDPCAPVIRARQQHRWQGDRPRVPLRQSSRRDRSEKRK